MSPYFFSPSAPTCTAPRGDSIQHLSCPTLRPLTSRSRYTDRAHRSSRARQRVCSSLGAAYSARHRCRRALCGNSFTRSVKPFFLSQTSHASCLASLSLNLSPLAVLDTCARRTCRRAARVKFIHLNLFVNGPYIFHVAVDVSASTAAVQSRASSGDRTQASIQTHKHALHF